MFDVEGKLVGFEKACDSLEDDGDSELLQLVLGSGFEDARLAGARTDEAKSSNGAAAVSSSRATRQNSRFIGGRDTDAIARRTQEVVRRGIWDYLWPFAKSANSSNDTSNESTTLKAATGDAPDTSAHVEVIKPAVTVETKAMVTTTTPDLTEAAGAATVIAQAVPPIKVE